MKTVTILITAIMPVPALMLAFALIGCSTNAVNAGFFSDSIPDAHIQHADTAAAELQLSIDNGVTVSIWPTEQGPLRVYAAGQDAPSPNAPPNTRTVDLPQQDQLLTTHGDPDTNITEIPTRDLEIRDELGAAAASFRAGRYAVTPVRGGAVFSVDGTAFLLQHYGATGETVTVNSVVLHEQLWHGLGGIAHSLDLSGTQARIRQHAVYGDQTYLHIPFFFSSAGHAVYYNASGEDRVSFGARGSGEMQYRSRTNYLDGLVWSTPSPKDTVASFYSLSDSGSLLPRWAFGYIQSKYGYRNQQEVYDTVARFEDLGIPLSALVLDLYWFDNMGDFAWDTEAFPNPDELNRFLQERDIRLITITEPYMTTDSARYQEFAEKGLLVTNTEGEIPVWSSWWTFDSPGGSMIDMAAEEIQPTLGKQYVRMMETGIDAFWTDLGEPEETPPGARFGAHEDREFHNYYNREWSRIIYEEITTAFPDTRTWILSRSGFTGSPRYNVSVWSGDVRSSFAALGNQAALGLGSGLTGFSYWGSDVGGFESGGQKPERELFIRWMQFGLFSPVFRAHGSQSPREPWIHDDIATAIIRSAIQMRHSLIPYMYSTAFQTYLDGLPMMRPLFFETDTGGNRNDEDLSPWTKDGTGWKYTSTNSYYFGDHILVHPITSPLSAGAETRIRLPQGTWYDFFTMEPIESNPVERIYNLNEYPVFLGEGAIVPMDREIDGSLDTIVIVPADEPSSFTYFYDDGTSRGYLEGDYEAIEITLSSDGIRFAGAERARMVMLVTPQAAAPAGFQNMGTSAFRYAEITRGETLINWDD